MFSEVAILDRTQGSVIGATAANENVLLSFFPLGFRLYNLEDRVAKQTWALPKAWGAPHLPPVWSAKGHRFVVPCGNKLFAWNLSTTTLQDASTKELAMTPAALHPFSNTDDILVISPKLEMSVLGSSLNGDIATVNLELHNGHTHVWSHVVYDSDERNHKVFLVTKKSNRFFLYRGVLDRLKKNWQLRFNIHQFLPKVALTVEHCAYHASTSSLSVLWGNGKWHVYKFTDATAFLTTESVFTKKSDGKKGLFKGKCVAVGPVLLTASRKMLSLENTKSGVLVGTDVIFGSRHGALPVTVEGDSEDLAAAVKTGTVHNMILIGETLVMCMEQYVLTASVSVPEISLSTVLNTARWLVKKPPPVPKVGVVNAAAFFASLSGKPFNAAPGVPTHAQGESIAATAGDGTVFEHPASAIKTHFAKIVDPAAEQDRQIIAELTQARTQKDASKQMSRILSGYLDKRRRPQGPHVTTNAPHEIRRVAPAASPAVVQTALHLCLTSTPKILGPVSLMLNFDLISSRTCPALITTLLAEHNLGLLEKSLKCVPDITEMDLVLMLKYFLTDVSGTSLEDYATRVNSAPGIVATSGEKGFAAIKQETHDKDSIRRLFLDLILSTPYSEPFLAKHLKELSLTQVIRALKYCKSLLQQYGVAPHTRKGKGHRTPTVANVLDWTNCLIDAHLQSLLLTPQGVEIVTSLRSSVSKEYNLCSNLEQLQGLLFHIIHKKHLPVPPVPDFRVEHIEF